MIEKYSESGLNKDILKSIDELGFVDSTPVQAAAIPFILNKKNDLIALAHTGTGKTAAFGLPILQQVDIDNKHTQAIILSPTRELCMQICDDLRKYSKHLKGVTITSVYGGANIDTQLRALKKGVHIVVGTPGRTLDLIKRKALKLETIKWVVLDEADEMLNMGFQEDLDAILENTPHEKRTFLFSATMPKSVLRIAERYMNTWEKIAVDSENTGASNVKHHYYVTKASNRFEALKRIVDVQPDIYGIIFTRTRREAKELADSLMQNGYNADALHGDIPQAQRTVVMNRFKKRQLQLLVATDVAARGVDVTDLTHVINYNLPDDREVYVHRSGRTGRAGKFGVSIAIVHSRELNKIRDIERFAKVDFQRQQIPTGSEICERQLFNLVNKIEETQVSEKQIEKFLPAIYDKLSHLSREELIQKMVSVEFNRFLEYYRNAQDLNVDVKSDRKGNDKKVRENFTTLSLSVGKDEGMDARNLIGMINELTDSSDIPIGRIVLDEHETLFEVDNDHKKKVLDAFTELAEEYPDVVVKEYGGVLASEPQRSRGRGGRSGSRNAGRGGQGGRSNSRNRSNRSGGDGRKGNRSGGTRDNYGNSSNKKRKPTSKERKQRKRY
ncbi:ATP-dependent RNA helicase DeaD [Balneicella halophila]|uniref:RNA helicase n=1 Tax=Balneicella halophila TaxID=1537566 RepID=A0A7L4UQC1_BALHA|nr:DEAD/DEAH box helicase [Balneicella halophila]PVX51087.1 ATP-dependent RNA helicase DeaD [Balneicella halophila]